MCPLMFLRIVDLFNIKLWDKDKGHVVVHDNRFGESEDVEPATEIEGGSIVIHKK